jgi:2-polyprenyl-3-methyl-5-hydroxy-6-metoxy-1,4-benzoquinol methylase
VRVHQETLSDTDRYIETTKSQTLADMMSTFQQYLRLIGKVRIPNPDTRILEIGVGTGWFPLICKTKGWNCKGLEISPQLIEVAMETGRAHGVVPDIELGNIEESDIGREQYDIIVASSVFEHVELWRDGLEKVYAALKPGGVLYFESTNKFSFTSGEYQGVPLYGWLPNKLRYKLRIMVQGPDVMKLGIDFNQFTYFGLRRAFRQIGFKTIYDRVDIADVDRMAGWKRRIMLAARGNRLLRTVMLFFMEATTFVCVK